MISDWETNHLFLSYRLKAEEPALVARLRSAFAGIPIDIIPNTKDIWCRDYMPVQIGEKTFCQFGYAPDYLRGHEHLITPPCRLPLMHVCRQDPIVLDGGNIVASRSRVILTDKVYKENPSIERPSLRRRLEEAFQAECIFIPKEPYDVIGHSDGVVRFVSENRVLVNDYSTVDPGYGARLRKLLEGNKLEMETLPMFQENDGGKSDFQSAVGIYIT